MEKPLISKYMSRVAAVGAAGALGAVALVGIAPSADAAKPLATNYTCDIVGGLDTAVTIGLPSSVKAKDAKKGLSAKSFTLTITLSEGIASALRGLTDTVAGSASGVAYKVDGVKKAVAVNNLAIKPTDVGTSGPLVLKAQRLGQAGRVQADEGRHLRDLGAEELHLHADGRRRRPPRGRPGLRAQRRCSCEGRQPQGQVTSAR